MDNRNFYSVFTEYISKIEAMDLQIEKLLDGIGFKILAELQKNARMPLSRIGDIVGLSAPAVAERVKKMEEAGIIQGYHTRIDHQGLGRCVSAFIYLTADPRHYRAIEALAADLDQISACHHVSGGASFIIQVLVEDLPALESVIGRLSPFGQTQTAIVLSTYVDKQWTFPLL